MTLKRAKEVIAIEAQAIKDLARHLDKNFLSAVELLYKCRGRVIVTGMGKTGIIGRKIAATLSSTGTPSLWMHSAEAIHGDLGQVTRNDVVIVLSSSGETEETTKLLPIVKKIGAKIIAMTGNPKSNLAKYSDVVLNVTVKREGCPLGLAPMASTTANLVMGDCLAACLIERKGFRKEDFAFYHPGGALGRQLLLKVEDIMRVNFPKVKGDVVVKDVLLAITRARCGSACVVDANGKLSGIFTDGDLRRHLEADSNLSLRKVREVMTKGPTTILKEKLAVEASRILKEKRIDEIPVVDKKGKPVGLLDVQDLLKVGLV
ncbi:MAG TPA: KpsF/GutQ family sugar-phosphate isomerase [Candidatus Omnitrophota bacterium]|nr:KpsF/GutQ family sugar-phosphate isomerase [Candidatus Omnitrophota bacterium]HPD84991.1 KpsF/GutQ family sugar-phosphate isomerase [Candidatus Omnitrophota bacterium]HRZ03849.1 KpsF/GutQ family sugar-phosphate isomerase [Candidatus Omnitrophota bacterium]